MISSEGANVASPHSSTSLAVCYYCNCHPMDSLNEPLCQHKGLSIKLLSREAEEARKKLEAAQAREAATLAAQHEAESRLALAAEAEKAVKVQAAEAQHAQEHATKELQQAKQACFCFLLQQFALLSFGPSSSPVFLSSAC